jgi:hypothetical protein
MRVHETVLGIFETSGFVRIITEQKKLVGVIGFTPHILCSALRAALKRVPKRSRRFGEPTRPLRALVVGKSTCCGFV